MANTVIGASVEVEFSSVGNMRKALKEANQELIRMQAQFGDASMEALAAAEKVGTLKGQIKDAAETANLFDPSKKFQAFVDLGANIASGFSAVQGAMALVGVESEDLQKTMVKLQGAMALAQGLGQLREFGESWGRIIGVVKKATIGVSAFGKALMATGIGLIIAAVGTLVAYWDDLTDAISGANEMTKAYGEAQKEATKAVADANTKLTEVTTAFKLAKEGKIDATDALDTYNESLGNTFGNAESLAEAERLVAANTASYIKAINARTQAQVFYAKAAEAAAKAQSGEEVEASFFQTAENFVKNFGLAYGPLSTFEEDQYNTRLENQQEFLNQQKIFTEQGDKLIQEALEAESKYHVSSEKKTKSTNDAKLKSEQEYQRKVAELRQKGIDLQFELINQTITANLNARDKEIFDLSVKYNEQKKLLEQSGQTTAILTQIHEKQKQEIIDKYAKEEKKKREEVENELNKINEEIRLLGIKDIREKEKAELAISYADQLREIEANENYNAEQKAQFRAALITKQKLEEDALNEKFRQEDLQKKSAEYLQDSANDDLSFADRLAKIKAREDLESQIVFESEQARTDFKKQNADARTKIAEAEKEAIIQALDAVAQTLSNASDLLGKNTKVGKVMAIAAATISMLTSAQKAYEATVGIPFVGPALAPVNAALAIAAGIKNIKEISKVKIPGQGGVPTPTPPPAIQTGSPMSPVLSPAVQGQAINADAINNLGNTALRAYVMNSDIQNNDQRNAYLQRNARIG